MGKARQINIVAFAIGHQGAELLGAEGKKLAFWPFLEVLRQLRAHTGGKGPHKGCAGILGSVGAHA